MARAAIAVVVCIVLICLLGWWMLGASVECDPDADGVSAADGCTPARE